MASKLFLLEFHVGTIEFDASFEPVPTKEEILINIKFADVSINIDPDDFPHETNVGEYHKVLYNMGKSYMFISTPEELIENFKGKCMEVSLRVNQKTEGFVVIPWSSHFSDMVKLFENVGVVKAVDYNDVEILADIRGNTVCRIEISVRLSCFGDSVETQYEAKPVGNQMEYILKNPYDNHTFKCELLSGTRLLPVVNLLSPIARIDTAAGNDNCVSWTEIFGTDEAHSRASYSPFSGGELQAEIPLTEILRNTSMETISIVFRPEENKFYDLANVLKPDVTAAFDATLITFTKEKKAKAAAKAAAKAHKKDDEETAPRDESLELTADKINRKLCKNKDCPAAIKFKEYGIGPLATGKGLGTLYGHVEPPAEYGLSHTYGTMSKYGPFGVFSKPKSPDQPFVPSKDVEETEFPKPNKKYCKACSEKLKDQSSVPIEDTTEGNKKSPKKVSSDVRKSWSDKLKDQPSVLIEDVTEGNKKSPKEVTSDVRKSWSDKLTDQSSGPIEDATEGNKKSPKKVTSDVCKSCSDKLTDQPSGPIEDATEGNKKSPKKVSNDVLRLRGGGPGLNQFLVPITKNFDPRKVSESNQTWNGTPRLRAGGPLDGEGLKSPIKECKDVMDKFDEILVAYKKALGPCGQAVCPNAPGLAKEICRTICGKGESIPPDKTEGRLCEIPCDFTDGFPACRDPKCAYAKYKLDLVDNDAALELQFLPPAVSGKCGHPKCPYPIQPNLPPIHWDCPDPLPKGACNNLNCPHQPPDLKKLQCLVPKPGTCGSPHCPYALPPPCDLPTCPFRPKPTCPFLAKQQKSSYQPEEEEGDYVCENPECPFANEKISASESFDDPNLKGHFIDCDNPECPFATKGKQRPKAKSDNINICGNPSCPFANVRKQKECNHPCCGHASKLKKQNEPRSEPCSKPRSEPGSQPRSEPCSEPGSMPRSEPGSKLRSEPGSKPRSEPGSKLRSEPGSKPRSEPGSEPGSKPRSEPGSKPRNGSRRSHEISKFETSTPVKSSSRKTKGNNSETCDDPDCFVSEIQKTNSNSKGSDVCDNPKCPSAGKTNNNSDRDEEEKCSKNSADCNVVDDSCANPECPNAEVMEEPAMCENPECPYMQSVVSCEVPECPTFPTLQDTKTQSIAKERASSKTQDDIILVETVTGDGNANAEEKGKSCKKGRKKRSKFVYSMGNQYPGVKVGHKECVTPTFKVPPKMGWLWNIPMEVMSMKPRRGWKPGAIQKDIAARIRAHREAKGLGILRLPKFKKAGVAYLSDEDDVHVTPKPTLQIQKKDGAYWITMNPLKDPKTLVDNENPYMECTPLQFKITKNKKKKDEDGSVLCYCEQDESSSSSDSELDIEFTPPAGIIHPERFKKKKNIVHCEVQYDPKDFLPEKPEGGEKKGKEKKGKKGKKEKGGKKKK